MIDVSPCRSCSSLTAALALTAAVAAAAPGAALAQGSVTTYYMHKEASTDPGLLRLATAGPDAARQGYRSPNLRNQPPGSGTIQTFLTDPGVPGLGGVIPAGSTVVFTLWMLKSSAAGTVFPQAAIGLNYKTTTPLCKGIGPSPVTTELAAHTFSCTIESPITLNSSDRLVVAAGYSMTEGPGPRNLSVGLVVEGRQNPSRVIAPNPIAPVITSLTPDAGPVGASIVVGGTSFGASQGTGALTFNGAPATPSSWSDTTIIAPVPAGATTGPVVVTVGGAASNGFAFTVQAESAGQLEITSPPEGTIVSPGQDVSVSVGSPDNAPFTMAAVFAEGIPFTDPAPTLPATFTVTIPQDARLGTFLLNAAARTASGESSFATVALDVERSDFPLLLEAPMPLIDFKAQGEESRAEVQAEFPGGAVLDVTESSFVTYASSDSGIATVDGAGNVTAVGEGTATIIATYSALGQSLTAEIMVVVPAPLFAAAPAAMDFGDQVVGTSSAQTMTVTNVSSGPLTIDGVTATGDFSAAEDCVSQSPLAPGGTCTVTVTFAPTLTGLRLGAVGISTTFHIVPVSFGLRGNGVGQ